MEAALGMLEDQGGWALLKGSPIQKKMGLGISEDEVQDTGLSQECGCCMSQELRDQCQQDLCPRKMSLTQRTPLPL